MWSAGPATRRRRRLNSGREATAAPPSPAAAARNPPSTPTPAPTSAAAPTTTPSDPPSNPEPTHTLHHATKVAVMPARELRAGVAALRGMSAAPVVEFVRAMVARTASPQSSRTPPTVPKKGSYDLVTTAAASKCIMQLCQLAPHLLAPVFDAVIAVFGTVRDQVTHAFAAKSRSVLIANVESAGCVLLDMVSLLQQLLAVARYYSKYSALVRVATVSSTDTMSADGTVPAPENTTATTTEGTAASAAPKTPFAGVPAELNSSIEEVSGPKSSPEALSAGNIAKAHAVAHNELLIHLQSIPEKAKADAAKAAQAGPSGTSGAGEFWVPLGRTGNVLGDAIEQGCDEKSITS